MKSERWLAFAVLATALAIGWFYVWTVRSSGDPWKFGREQRDYYNLLLDGWLDGQLHMKVDVPAALLALPDPYDPRLRPPGLALHDATLFEGKYYLYFGAGPVVTLLLPFRLLTGTDLPQALAVLVFTFGGFLASLAVWLALRRRYFPESGTTVAMLVTLVLGCAALGPMLLRRPHVWELPIAAGYCFAMLTLFAVWRALHARGADDLAGSGTCPPTQSGGARMVWFGAAGLFLGCAIASRPTYLVASPLLLPPLIYWWHGARRLPWRETASVVAPLAVIGALMALHNYARFGDPLQFGQAYQLSLDYESKVDHFSLRYIGFNAWRYFFSAAEWSWYFPFIAPAALPEKPAGFGGHDDVYGIFANLWIAAAAVVAPAALWRRSPAERSLLGTWLMSVGLLFATLCGLLLCFFGSLARYMMEFAPALMLLAAVGVLGAERELRRWPSVTARSLPRLAWGGAAIISAVFAVLFSLQLNRLLLEKNPEKDRAVARVLNQIPAFFERAAGMQPGAWEADVRFPAGRAGAAETLLSVGEPPHVARVVAQYVTESSVRIGFAQGAMPPIFSDPVSYSPSEPQRVRVILGALFPPAEHPWFQNVAADDARRAARLVRIEVHGRPVVHAYRRFDAGAAARLRVGSRSLGEPAHPRFTGDVSDGRRVPMMAAEIAKLYRPDPLHGRGDVFTMRITLPHQPAVRREPLVVTGSTGRGDVLGIEYVEPGCVRFFFDHWGSPLVCSEPITLDRNAGHELVVRFPWLSAFGRARPEEQGMLGVVLNGRTVWELAVNGYIAEPEEVAAGMNPIGGSYAGSAFSGKIVRVERTASN